jgi:STAS domain
VVVCDVGRITEPDAPTLDALVRLQLTARRLGVTIELHNACPALVDLIACAGLSDVLVVAGPGGHGSGVEVHGQVEEREQRGVDEEVLGGDTAV